MSTIIGAEAAKLAGLQIDQLTKLRSGQMTLDQIERFNNLSLDDREARFGGVGGPKPEPAQKFALLADLGEITVPDDYVHGTRLGLFKAQHQDGEIKSFYYYNDAITDANFPNPTRVLKPGDKLRVRAFKQIVPGTTTSEERMAFLATQKAVHTGAQGVSLVFEQKRTELPKGYWYASFDEVQRLWEDAGGDRRVPNVRADSGGAFDFDLGCFERVWFDDGAFFCFCDFE